MGKKKQKTQKPIASELSKPATQAKEQKSYNASTTQKSACNDDKEEMIKVQLPVDKEAAIVDIILNFREQQKKDGTASQRMSSKKLTDMYTSLTHAGFSHNQVDQAMTATVKFGGDLMDALDWLCLNTRNDQLPKGFSEMMRAEEDRKKKPKFSETAAGQTASLPTAPKPTVTSKANNSLTTADKSVPKEKSMKSWILQYADQSSDEEDGEGVAGAESKPVDTNDRYIELTSKLLDLKSQATSAKEEGGKTRSKKLSHEIRTVVREMDLLEAKSDFNPKMMIFGIEDEKQSALSAVKKAKKAAKAAKLSDDEQDDIGDAFNLFEEQAAAEPKPKKKKAKLTRAEMDIRDFEYTKQQWTGKSPKQFLIDWMRKHFSKSPAPSFNKVDMGGGLHRSRVKIVGKDGVKEYLPDIVCENLKEAEHLACTLALYHLCKGQRVYQLLPPPYRDCWLEWQDAETKAQDESKAEKNKPREMLISKLLQELKLISTCTEEAGVTVDAADECEDEGVNESDNEEGVDSWEDLADEKEALPEPKRIPEKKDVPVPYVASSPHQKTTKEIYNVYQRHERGHKFRELLEQRQKLPVYHYREEVTNIVRNSGVVVIAGETGSGKSTQIPHFLLEDSLRNDRALCNIVVTQPRRISAISLANRVCDEMGEGEPGSRDSLCGYQIRFESKRGPFTRLSYCTTGVLLRRLQIDPNLKDISHVIVDEVHERSVQSDFLLVVLQRLMQKRGDLRIVLMSATLDSNRFCKYFSHCPLVNIPGRAFPVQVFHVEDVIEKTGYNMEDDSPYAARYDSLIEEDRQEVNVTGKGGTSKVVEESWDKQDIMSIDQSGLDSEQYSKKTRNIVTRLNPDRINMDLIMCLLANLDSNSELSTLKGAVLIFLPGFAHIQELHEMLLADRKYSDKRRYLVVALHSILSSHDQTQAFTVPPDGVRKIVLATNIAETGITIPDVVFVIDSGKVKENRYRESSQLSSLEEVYVSKASAKQRQGRAGRVTSGVCFRLYTKVKFASLPDYSVPEILRVPLEELCLHILKCEMGHPEEFLSQALDPPSSQAVNRAMSVLQEVGACTIGKPSLTALGHHLASLPVNVRIGKMLIFGAMLGCLQQTAVVAASMSDKSPFAVPLGKRAQADSAKATLAVASSDSLTIYKSFLGWQAASKDGYRAEQQYCNKFFLKRSALIDIKNVASDLVRMVRSIGFHDTVIKRTFKQTAAQSEDVINIHDTGETVDLRLDQLTKSQELLLKAVLTAGLYPNLAKISHVEGVDDAAYPGEKRPAVAQTAQGQARIHPGSVNKKMSCNGLMVYHEKVRVSRVYIRESTLISPYPLLLFGGEISVRHQEQVITIDDWIHFTAYAKTGVVFKDLRILIEDLLRRKLNEPKLDIAGDPVVGMLTDLIVTEKYRPR